MPLREVEERFTKSEIVLFAWRSQEQYWQFKRKTAGAEEQHDYSYGEEPQDNEIYEPAEGEEGLTPSDPESRVVERVHAALDKQFGPKTAKKPKPRIEKIIPSRTGKRRKHYDGVVPAGLPDRFYNSEGDIDLSQVTGDDAYKYFASIGMPLPIIQRFDR